MPYDHSLWFYGTSPKKVVRWAGYSLGYELVRAYIDAHPDFDLTKDFAVDAALFAPKR